MRKHVGAFVALFALTVAATSVAAEGPAGAPFKLGTFELQGRTFVGLVTADETVIDVAAANAALEKAHPTWPKMTAPTGMRDLIARYETGGLKERLHAIAAEAKAGAPYARPRKSLRIRPPVPDPENMLNAAVNYSEHDAEMQRRETAPPPAPASLPKSAPGLWERAAGDTRQNPYLFLKARSALVADGDAIRIPPGREQVDWECEMAVVIGRRGDHIPVAKAVDSIFGYTLEHDVSDRGGRGDTRLGSDWLVGKSHDTFAPLGPYIVPKEFLPDPQKLRILFTLSGTQMQDSNTDRMIHNVYELVHYASNILTLQPGDVISTGSPAGVGSARNPPIFMKAGDVAACTIEGIGTLTNPVAATESR